MSGPSGASGPAGTSAVLVWGAFDLTGSTVTRWLFAGYSNDTAQASRIRFKAPRSGTLRNLFVTHNTPNGNGNPIVYTIYVAGAPTALSVSMASTAPDGNDTTHSVAVLQGQDLELVVTKASVIANSPQNIVAALELAA